MLFFSSLLFNCQFQSSKFFFFFCIFFLPFFFVFPIPFSTLRIYLLENHCSFVFKMYNILIFILFHFQLSAHLNPGCPYTVCKNIDGDELKNTTVIHVEADGPSNTLHYIWDLRAHHTPSVLVALTELNTNVTIDWEQFLNDTPNTVSFTNNPIYTMTFLFTKVSYMEVIV